MQLFHVYTSVKINIQLLTELAECIPSDLLVPFYHVHKLDMYKQGTHKNVHLIFTILSYFCFLFPVRLHSLQELSRDTSPLPPLPTLIPFLLLLATPCPHLSCFLLSFLLTKHLLFICSNFIYIIYLRQLNLLFFTMGIRISLHKSPSFYP